MSLVKRTFLWRCDDCGLEVEREAYGVPPSWSVVDKTLNKPTVTHRCRHCTKYAAEHPQRVIVNDS